MSFVNSMDHNLRVRTGGVPGHTMAVVAGHTSTLTTTRTTLAPELTTGNIDQSGIAATPATVDVASTSANDTSAGTGLRTLTLSGLDTNGAEISETITMNGQTEVTSVNTYSAVNGLTGLTAGSGVVSAGNIYCGTGTFTAGVPATIFFVAEAGFNSGLSAYYVVPAGKSAYYRQFSANIASANKDVEWFLEASADGVFWVTAISFGLESGGSIPGVPVLGAAPISGGGHVRVQALSSASATISSVVLDLELVDD